ncbi:hypothetical protein CY34DRAFT_713761 [Suillus luteus UH-Slu-Lm8-n1]|uniref:Uncharacterized protein n=1 Tax=Suillus luteus UH-Slu-Lm8-n1 TaxID=930992 RepID=A0A0C9ZVE1_9AGAM|nr:hypothetical protein CY34DRAFT_713761 [Suillus luteus UH-Slu-Lm8-n1]
MDADGIMAMSRSQEFEVRDLLFLASHWTLTVPRPCPDLSIKSFYALLVRFRVCLPDQVMSRVHMTHIMDPAAWRRLSMIMIRRKQKTAQTMERKKTEKMSLCSREWRTDVINTQSSDVVIQMCRIGCTLGDASTEIWDAAYQLPTTEE